MQNNKELYNYLIRDLNSSVSQFNTAINSMMRINMTHAVYEQLVKNNVIEQYKDYYASFYNHNFGITLLMTDYRMLIDFLEKEQKFIREKDLNFKIDDNNINILKNDMNAFIKYKKLTLSRKELIKKRNRLEKKLVFKQIINIITLNSIRGIRKSIKNLKFLIDIADKQLESENK